VLRSLILSGYRLFLGTLLVVTTTTLHAQTPDFARLIVDDEQADLTGTWKPSTSVSGYFGSGYRHASGPELHTATFTLLAPSAGEYHLLIAFTPGTNRAANVPVVIDTADGERTIRIDQQKTPAGPLGLYDAGKFNLAEGETSVVFSTEDAKGVVIIDGVGLLSVAQFAAAQQARPLVGAAATKLAVTPKKNDPSQPPAAPIETAPPFVRVKLEVPPAALTPGQLDDLLAAEIPELATASTTSDELFVRRVSLDLIGRNPTRGEMQAFVQSTSPNKRAELIDQLLASPEFGTNWGHYFSDVVSYRVPSPELTFLNYQPFRDWLSECLNRNMPWDELTYRVLTAQGKVGEHPEATFVGFHQGEKSRLAAETTRVFMATQIQCAECHDHKFIDLSQETFHHFAAFFARSQAKIAQNNSSLIEVVAKTSGEYTMPGKKEQMEPMAFEMAKVEIGASDITRRVELARWVVSPENPFFAKALVNRVWARLMGRGFCEPVDEIGELADRVMPRVHSQVAEHFIAHDFDVKSVFRLIANTQTYQRELNGDVKDAGRKLPKIITTRLRGDEVFQSLVAAIELPNVTPPPTKATAAVRFPPPPQSTRDLVDEAFGYDPSISMRDVSRTMVQAMFMMNNEQIQRQIDARPESGTHLAKILSSTQDDREAIGLLFQDVLVRRPTPSEEEIALQHIASVKNRPSAYEDLLWGLLNSAEFTTRR
jgi:hypothetical protein